MAHHRREFPSSTPVMAALGRFERRRFVDVPLPARSSASRVRAVLAFRRSLRRLFADPDAWLRTPNPALGGKRPGEVLAGREGIRRLRELVARIECGVPV